MMGSIYRRLEDIRLGELFPAELMPTEEERAAVNRLFRPYLFFKNRGTGREIWASCCRRNAVIYHDTPNAYEALTSPHNRLAACPFCGRQASMKETRYLGKRKGLEEYETAVFLRAAGGGLTALTAWVGKDYQEDLLEEPRYHITCVYSFRPNIAVQHQGFWGDNKPANTFQEYGNINPKKWRITEPFTVGSGCEFSYVPYTVFGLDAIGQSSFRYCQYESFKSGDNFLKGGRHDSLMKYLAACCIWPRDMEMLVKKGFRELVQDLLWNRRKNSRAYRWGASDVKEAFGLDGQELRAFMASERKVKTLALYKELRKRGGSYSFELADNIRAAFRDEWERRDFLAVTKRFKIDAGRALRYIARQISPCAARHGASHKDVLIAWIDYLDNAATLGFDFSDETVVMPKELGRKHDEAAEERSRREWLAIAQNDMQTLERLNGMLAGRIRKYDFAYGGYIIRTARNAEEIVAEGNALKHCVGGYASRHMEGKLTILFLRRADAPGESLATIEMDGNKLQQIHGYRNDAGKKPAAVTYKAILDIWLDWLGRGSPRNKDGSPKLRRAKKGDNAA